MIHKKFTVYRPAWVLAILSFIISFFIVEVVFYNKVVNRFEKTFSDFWHQIAKVRYEPTHTLIINIDDKSLSTLTDAPLVFWTPYFAEVVRGLKEHNAKVIGLDFLFSTTAEQWLRSSGLKLNEGDYNYDQPMRVEIASGKIVLVSTTANGIQKDKNGKAYTEQILPTFDMLLSVPELDFVKYLSYADLYPDNDGVIRTYADAPEFNFTKEVADSNPPIFSFATLLALHYYNYSEGMVQSIKRTGKEKKTIVFSGPPRTIPNIAFIDYLNALREPEKYRSLINEYKEKIAGKVVIIGSDYVGLNDNHITPYGTNLFNEQTLYMSGPEIQANITEALLSQKTYKYLDPEYRWIIEIIVLLITAFAFRYLTTGWGTLVMFTICAIIALFGYLFFQNFIEFPVVALQVGVIFSFVFIYLFSFSGETRKRLHIEKVFGRYVSRKVVEEYIESGQMPSLGGESSVVTVLFSDIRNFTRLSELINPQELVEIINQYFELATPCVLSEDGHLDKFIGDAIMAEFGMPARHPDHALRACRAAVKLVTVAEEFGRYFHTKLPELRYFTFEIGVGINSGSVIMGNIGSSTKTDYTALGDTVNVASRLETATKTTGWKIVASQETIDMAGDRVIIGRKDKINVKGRVEAITIYEILGIKE